MDEHEEDPQAAWIAFTFDSEPVYATPATIPHPVRVEHFDPTFEASTSSNKRPRAPDALQERRVPGVSKSPRKAPTLLPPLVADSRAMSTGSSAYDDEDDDDDDDDGEEEALQDGDEDFVIGSSSTGKRSSAQARRRQRRSSSAASSSVQRSGSDLGPEDVLQGRWALEEVSMVMHVARVYVEQDLRVIADIANFCEVRRPRRAIDKQLKRVLKYARWVGRCKETLLAKIDAVVESRDLPPLTKRQEDLLEQARRCWPPGDI